MTAAQTLAGPAAPLTLDLPRLEVRALPVPAALRLARFTAACALASMLLAHLGLMTFVDPDLWHETALAREIIARRAMPLTDDFAYTPTVSPVVHHEWGTGMVLHLVTLLGGAGAVMALKYALSFGAASFCFAAARKRGASWDVILSLAPVTILCGVIGFTTIRAQLFTLFFVAWLLYDLADAEQSTAGAETTTANGGWKKWLKWLPFYVAWLNLHAGFVVGVGILALHGCERLCRRRPVGLLIAAGFALVALIAVNPYGFSYYPYLARALTMPRPLVTEWQPLWTAEPTMFRVYLTSLLIVLYAAAQLGVRRMPGLLILAVCAFLAARHTRHLSIYLIVWLSLVPGYVERTRLGKALRTVWLQRRRWIAAGAALALGFCGTQAMLSRPWELVVPTTLADEQLGRPVYPVGAVEYLREQNFHGNLFVPFVPGGYCLYQLHPAVKVSLDGRYEVAYAPGLLEENVAFYAAKPGWRETLQKYPTDAVLVPCSSPVAADMPQEAAWRLVYADAVYRLYVRAELPGMPKVERSAAPFAASFP